MKLSEIKFKVITGTPERNRAVQEAVFKAGGSWCNKCLDMSEENKLSSFALEFGDEYDPTLSRVTSGSFEAYDTPEMTLPQVLELLSKVEVKKEFNIQFKQDVLVRDGGHNLWRWSLYSGQFQEATFLCLNGLVCRRMLPLEGNEHLLGKTDTPDGWWEVKAGEPVWVTK